jgi:hypothetical protein
MRLDPNPLFRRVITPWYDSNMVCGILLLAMAVIIIFSAVGIAAAREYTAYHAYIWVPSTLLALSVLVFISVAVRMIQRDSNPTGSDER